jgi:predicted nucleotidyltransferase
MDKTDVLRIARHFAVAAKDTLPVSNAWLYGSWVYGNPTSTSDIDIALELDQEPRNVLQLEKQLQKLRRSLDLLMVEPIVIDSAHDRSGFSQMIVQKGEKILP